MKQQLTAADYAQMPDEALAEISWRIGEISWKLDPHQLVVYERYRRWEQEPPSALGEMPSVFVLDISRRWGKSFLCCAIKIEDCLRYPGTTHTYACAFAKDIGEIIRPLVDSILDDCPEDILPKFQLSKGGKNMGYYFPNGSVLRLVGIDVNPRGLRGRASDGFVVSEAGHVKDLENTMRSVVLPQFQRRPRARMILESNAPEDYDHDFDRVFVPDSKMRDAYVFATIDDNVAIGEEEKQRQIRELGGMHSPRVQREFYGKRVRDPEKTILPEFSDLIHVAELDMPPYAHGYLSADPGSRDLFGLLAGFWLYSRQTLYIVGEWAEANAATADVADAVRTLELEHFSGVKYGDGSRDLFPNPYKRVTDVDHNLVIDMRREHGISFALTRKDDAESAELALRDAVIAGKVVIHPRCKKTIAHFSAARRTKSGNDWERPGGIYGHFDLLACAIYMWRNIDKHADPKPNLLPSAPAHLLHVPANYGAPKPTFEEAMGIRKFR